MVLMFDARKSSLTLVLNAIFVYIIILKHILTL